MNIREMVEHILNENGYTALVHAETECGCHIDDLFLCDCASEKCQAGHWIQCFGCGKGMAVVEVDRYTCSYCGHERTPEGEAMNQDNDVKITYRGWPGHYCRADKCLFRLNTLVECGGCHVVISTVGKMRDEYEGIVEIGCGRHYETMAFMAEYDGTYWDADVTREVRFYAPFAWKFQNEGTDQAVNDGHEAVVAEIAQAMRDGTFVPPEEV